jgi:outer membrane protein assembly factor BamB
VVIGDTVYFGSEDGNFYALDVESGYMHWGFKSGAEINSIPYADKDQVYFGSKDGKLYALSRKSGEEKWSFRTRSQINSQVERYGDSVIFCGDADAIYFLSPEGKEQFRIENRIWEHFTFLMADNVMYFAPGPSRELISPFDIEKREYLWHLPYHDIAAMWYSFTAVSGDLLYFGTADVQGGMHLGFYAYNRHTGKRVWEQRVDGVIKGWDTQMIWDLFVNQWECLDHMAPTVWKNLVIFTGGDTSARAFDKKTGALRWEKKYKMPVSSAPTIASGRVYFGLLGDDHTPSQFICISARDGKLLWQMETEGSLLSSPVIAGKRIIFGTDKNVFYVLEQVF